MIETGYIALHRRAFKHGTIGAGRPMKPADPKRGAYSRMEAWLWLCSGAAHAPHRNGVQLQRGQLVASVPELASEWNWGVRAARQFLDKLAAEGSINRVTRRGRAGYVLTICKYDEYQPGGSPSRQSPRQSDYDFTAEHIEKKKEKKNKKKKVAATLLGSDPSQPVMDPVSEADKLNGVEIAPPPPPKSARSRPEECIELYNALAPNIGWPQVTVLNEKRATSIRKRDKEVPWETMLERLRDSDWLKSESFRNKSISFLLRPGNYAELCDGNFSKKKPPISAGRSPQTMSVSNPTNDQRLAAEQARVFEMNERRKMWGAALLPMPLSIQDVDNN